MPAEPYANTSTFQIVIFSVILLPFLIWIIYISIYLDFGYDILLLTVSVTDMSSFKGGDNGGVNPQEGVLEQLQGTAVDHRNPDTLSEFALKSQI